MELLALVIVWPFLIFATGLIFIAFSTSFTSYDGYSGFEMMGGLVNLLFWVFLFFLIYLIATRHSRKNFSHLTPIQQLSVFRSWTITFSIALILPIFVRYIVDALNHSLLSIIAGIVIGFSVILWGMFMKVNNTIMYGNVFGGALILFYVYFQLGDLGEFARIVAAGISLAFAVFIAVIKFKDKLT